MSGFGTGEIFPTWEQLLSGVGAPAAVRSVRQPRHVREWAANPFDETMSWGEAAAWSGVAVTGALVVSRWAAHLLG